MLNQSKLKVFQHALNWTDPGITGANYTVQGIGDYVHCKLIAGRRMMLEIVPGGKLAGDMDALAMVVAKRLREKWVYEYGMPLLEASANAVKNVRQRLTKVDKGDNDMIARYASALHFGALWAGVSFVRIVSEGWEVIENENGCYRMGH